MTDAERDRLQAIIIRARVRGREIRMVLIGGIRALSEYAPNHASAE